MNTNIDVFRMAASRTLEPEAGAAIILKRRRLQREATKPEWMPRWVFALCTILMIVIVSAVGGRSNSRS
jgi:hypothetical protein